MPQNQRGFIQYLVIFILLIGIAITVYLVQFTQIFKPKADTAPYLSKVTDAAFEPFYNPFGDPWAWKKSPNPYIPVSLGVPSYWALGPKKNTNEVPEREIEYLAKSNAPILYMDSAILQLDRNPIDNDSGKLAKLKNLISRLKARGVKVIGYTVAHQGVPWANWLDEYTLNRTRADEENLVRPDYYESFYVHKKGLPPTRENRVSSPIMDITNPQYRAFIIPKMVEAMKTMGLGGVLMDGVFYDLLELSKVKDEVPPETAAAWPGAAAIFTQELKSAMGPDLLLFANVGRSDVQYVANDLLRPGRLDGIMLEDPIGRSEQYQGTNNEAPPFIPGVPSYDNFQAMLKLAKERDKYVFIVVNTNVNCPPYPEDLVTKLNLPRISANLPVIEAAQNESRLWCYQKTNETWERRYASFFLAAYLQQFQSPKQMLVYYTPTEANPQFFSETFFKEWDLNIGNPVAQVEPVPGAAGIFLRKFERGYVYLNTTYDNYSIKDGNGIYSTTDGTEINKSVVPARSGRIFVTKSVLDSFNTPPPPPSPSSNPSTTAQTFFIQAPTVSCAGINQPKVHLEWTPLSGASTYDIFFRTQGSGETKIGTTGGTVFDILTSHGLTPGASYGFLIAATTPSGTIYSNGAWSDQVIGFTQIPSCITSPVPSSPATSPSPSASNPPATSSQSPAASSNKKPGDTDDDNDVDIFDYNLIVTNFGRTQNFHPRSDLDNDGDVDIFDYNIVVTWFNK